MLGVCKKYGYNLDYLDITSFLTSLFTYSISVWGTAKFQLKRAVRFGFPKEVTPVACLLEISYSKLWKGITSSTEIPLAGLLSPSKARPLKNNKK